MDLVGQGAELIIDQQHAVAAGERRDVAARALEQVQVGAQRRALDLDLTEVLLLGGQGAGGGEQQANENQARQHASGLPVC